LFGSVDSFVYSIQKQGECQGISGTRSVLEKRPFEHILKKKGQAMQKNKNRDILSNCMPLFDGKGAALAHEAGRL
jgi:hypothetical protein